MIATIARHTFTEAVRDGRFRVAAGLVVILVTLSGLLGWQAVRALEREAAGASNAERSRWLGQGDKNPHSAAHYGVYAFKTPRPLAVLDPGVQPYLGSILYLEAHRQNEPLYRPAQDTTAAARLGDLSAALVGRTLLPLLVILLGFAALAGERESGTLRQLLSLGVTPRALLAGKALGLGGALALVLIPPALLGLAAATMLAPPGQRGDEWARAVLWIGVHALYATTFLFLTLAVSARVRSSRIAIVVLLTFWLVTVVAWPRLLSDLGRWWHPTPSQLAFRDALDAALGDPHGRETLEVQRQAILKHYGVTSTADLPVNWAGIALQFGEERANGLFDRHYGAVWSTLDAQDRLFQFGSLASPAPALQLLSQALTGNDTGHHRAFLRQAETHRRAMQVTLNGALRDSKSSPSPFRWETIPVFHYQPPVLREALAPLVPSLALLFAWSAAAAAAALWSVRHLTPR
ncbi:MAG: DUF3526 domain-containing protein [Opitutaceae bacterium]|jgi:ABC-2 type transport system permease protein|nr:DUF3526 domain-containing protein [Opitutaceae bacterium]